ncbi:hypothetical protein [Lysinibacillus fusiformis]|uniref:hypothetical protein n=1 Tax=Lysinibacillus fusiformis TaxID=28031 RepID=UPI0021BE6998|nr:hypothetical protein [Lysinibacillus fusiformis]UXJ68744.1 hypothetical protein N5069_22050 [Lysinibacillus fusiformis]
MDKRIFSFCIILIAVISLFSPTIVSNLMLQQSTIMDNHYYIQYMANLSSVFLDEGWGRMDITATICFEPI